MAEIMRLAYDGAHGSGAYNQWRSNFATGSTGMLAGYTSAQADYRCAWLFEPISNITDAIASVTFHAFRTTGQATGARNLRIWYGLNQGLDTIPWNTAERWGINLTGIPSNAWYSVDLTARAADMKLITGGTNKIVIGWKPVTNSGAASISSWEWGAGVSGTLRAFLRIVTDEGYIYVNYNGTVREADVYCRVGNAIGRADVYANRNGIVTKA